MKRTLNTTINRSKSEKNDEHYTQLADIENEVRHGRSLSGSLQGAGGVGGLLYLAVSNSQLQLHVPCYDNNGNITRYLDANGNTVAQYTYNAFGATLSQSGAMCDVFRHRFSTKYYDAETGLYYYGYRFYSPLLMRRREVWKAAIHVRHQRGDGRERRRALISALRTAHKALAAQIEPKGYEYGFLKL